MRELLVVRHVLVMAWDVVHCPVGLFALRVLPEGHAFLHGAQWELVDAAHCEVCLPIGDAPLCGWHRAGLWLRQLVRVTRDQILAAD